MERYDKESKNINLLLKTKSIIYGAQNETYIEDERPKRNEVV